jgi:tetratricopeptide (TPR) repeat protein
MKTVVVCSLIVCAAVGAGTLYLDYRHPATGPAPSGDAAGVPANPTVEPPPPQTQSVAPKPEPSQLIPTVADAPAQILDSTPAPAETKPDDSTNSIHTAVDALLSAKNAGQKQALFDQLRKSGQLDAAIADLKQRMTDNPNDAEIPTTLGEAQLNELRAIKETTGDYNQIGILAMQADQSFNAALQIDPQNWEAQFVKYASMYYWPANPQMDNQVVLHLSALIDQQDTMAPDPGFAQTYLVLGNEFQKIGQPDKAQATWQLGLQKFPGDQSLQNKLANASN